MKLSFSMTFLLVGLITASMVIRPSQAAQNAPIINQAVYGPLVLNNYPLDINQIAFIGVDQNNHSDQYLYRINENGTGIKKMTVDPTPGLNFAWSPNGLMLSFSSHWSGNDEIYVMGADGIGLLRLTNDPASDEFPSWSPDGSKIAFNSNRQGSYQIYVMGVDGSNVTPLTNLTPGCSKPIWSPDGTKIAFNNWNVAHNGEDIYVMNSDGTSLLRLTDNSYFDSVAAWSPDSSKIMFFSNRDHSGANDQQDLYVMNKDGTNVVRMTAMWFIQAAIWSPYGNKIIFSNLGEPDASFIMNSDRSGMTELLCLSNSISSNDLSLSPDGNSIAFSRFIGVPGIYTVNIDGTNCQHLTTMLANTPKWRPTK